MMALSLVPHGIEAHGTLASGQIPDDPRRILFIEIDRDRPQLLDLVEPDLFNWRPVFYKGMLS